MAECELGMALKLQVLFESELDTGTLQTRHTDPFLLVCQVGVLCRVSKALQMAKCDREDASSMVTAGATANTTVKNSHASRESGLLCSHSHGESIEWRPFMSSCT